MTTKKIEKIYKQKTKNSARLHKKALKILPGGVACSVKFFDPYPIFMDKAQGAWLRDVDGNKFVDYLLSYGSMILGHAHPLIKKTIDAHLKNHGTILYGTPHVLENEYAQVLRAHYPSLEMMRFTNSGTEATLLSLRLAYAYTGKFKIAKFEGHFHGGYNQVLLSINPQLSQAGQKSMPCSVFDSAGIEPFQKNNTIVLPFNDIDSCRKILIKHKKEIAAVILEPYAAGFIAPKKDFLIALRKLTTELNILLIFDEVKTGFRIGLGGAQKVFGVKPDLTALGKVIGGGFPIGIVGGKKEILKLATPLSGTDVFDVAQSKESRASKIVFHSGSYNGHPLILSVGLAVIKELEKEMPKIISATTYLKDGIADLMRKNGHKVLMLGSGTMFNFVFSDLTQVNNYRDLQKSNITLRKKLDLALLTFGVHNKPTNRYCLSAAHDKKALDFTLKAFEKALGYI
jgi:glutamate-1-semialdehyde 2,1-aminomutase